jgi:hypothetical protein
MIVMDKEREAFEKWALEVNPNAKEEVLKKKESGEYISSSASLAWDVWQAATKQAKERERVLVELLDEAIFNAESCIVNMKDMKSGAGFSVREEAEWLDKAIPVLKQYESEQTND